MEELKLADTALYITLAIVIAVMAIVSSDIREAKSLVLRRGMNVPAFVAVVATWVCIAQILASVLAANEWAALSDYGRAHLIGHLGVLLLLLIFAPLWYVSILLHRETPSGMPSPPSGP